MTEFGDNKVDRRRYVESNRRSDMKMTALGFGMAGLAMWVMFVEPSQRTIVGGFFLLLMLAVGAGGAYAALQPVRSIVGARLIDGGFEIWGRAKPMRALYADIATVRAKVGIDGYG